MEIATKYLKRPDASAYVGERGLLIAKGTLAKLATLGGGPKYSLFCGRAYYLPDDLDAWITAKLSAPRQSTSEASRR